MGALRLCSRIRDEEAACVALAQVALHRTERGGTSFHMAFLYYQPIVKAIYREMSLHVRPLASKPRSHSPRSQVLTGSLYSCVRVGTCMLALKMS